MGHVYKWLMELLIKPVMEKQKLKVEMHSQKEILLKINMDVMFQELRRRKKINF